MAEKEGFEPSKPFCGLHDFQSCALDRTRRLLHSQDWCIIKHRTTFVKYYFDGQKKRISGGFYETAALLSINCDNAVLPHDQLLQLPGRQRLRPASVDALPEPRQVRRPDRCSRRSASREWKPAPHDPRKYSGPLQADLRELRGIRLLYGIS